MNAPGTTEPVDPQPDVPGWQCRICAQEAMFAACKVEESEFCQNISTMSRVESDLGGKKYTSWYLVARVTFLHFQFPAKWSQCRVRSAYRNRSRAWTDFQKKPPAKSDLRQDHWQVGALFGIEILERSSPSAAESGRFESHSGWSSEFGPRIEKIQRQEVRSCLIK